VAAGEGTVAARAFSPAAWNGLVAGCGLVTGAVLFLSIMLPLLQILAWSGPGRNCRAFSGLCLVLFGTRSPFHGDRYLCVGIAMVAPLLPIRLPHVGGYGGSGGAALGAAGVAGRLVGHWADLGIQSARARRGFITGRESFCSPGRSVIWR